MTRAMGRNVRELIQLAIGFLLVAGTAHAQGCATPLPRDAGALQTDITPVAFRILQQTLTPAPATDGFFHLAYAAQMTNVSHHVAQLDEIVPTDALRGFAATGSSNVLDMDGRDITGMVLPFKPDAVDGATPAKSVNTRRFAGGASGIAFFDLRYRTKEEIPRLISHRLLVALDGSDGPLTEQTTAIEVSCEMPVRISPPMTGAGWWDGNGCCTVISPHRGAVLPVNGDFRVPEQFAIDFEQLNEHGGCCTGPVKELSSWPFFRAPILAVADGVVVGRTDGMPEQVPGEVKGVNAQNAAGNSIIEDIGGGRYVLYAHLHTSSIPSRLVVGAKVASGEQIGELGNTGSSTAPHLHLQVMDRPSTLDAIGLPFVFDRQILEGRVIGTANQANEVDSGRNATVQRDPPTLQIDKMPVEGQVFEFHR